MHGLARPEWYHGFIENRCETLCCVLPSEHTGGPCPKPSPHPPPSVPKTGKALVMPLVQWVSMGGGNRIPSDDMSARLPLFPLKMVFIHFKRSDWIVTSNQVLKKTVFTNLFLQNRVECNLIYYDTVELQFLLKLNTNNNICI